MARKKPHQKRCPRGEPPYRNLTPNQVVAWNLARARKLRNWNQDQAAAALASWLGVRWSPATVSQAERSVAGKFIRNFTADEIVAFAGAFRLPVMWFFMPPCHERQPDDALETSPTDVAPTLQLLLGADEGNNLLDARLNGALHGSAHPPQNPSQPRTAPTPTMMPSSNGAHDDPQAPPDSIAIPAELNRERSAVRTPFDRSTHGAPPPFEAINDGGDADHWHGAVRSIADRLKDLKGRTTPQR